MFSNVGAGGAAPAAAGGASAAAGGDAAEEKKEDKVEEKEESDDDSKPTSFPLKVSKIDYFEITTDSFLSLSLSRSGFRTLRLNNSCSSLIVHCQYCPSPRALSTSNRRASLFSTIVGRNLERNESY